MAHLHPPTSPITPQFLLLLPPDDDYKGDEVVSSPAPLLRRRKEAAGVAWEAWLKRKRGSGGEEGVGGGAAGSGEAPSASTEKPSAAPKAPVDSSSWDLGDDDEDVPGREPDSLYAALGLQHLGCNASDAEIKRAYRRMILKHHPDKKQGAMASGGGKPRSAPKKPSGGIAAALLGGGGGEEGEDEEFLRIQAAFDTLSDPVKRRDYDSQFPFDESIPNGDEEFEDESGFYRLYGPVFRRNARFSVRRPVPVLGTPSDSWKKVDGFYRFWFSFESWRNFSQHDEFNLDDADSRDERRWMQQQNNKGRSKRKKAEMRRILRLVERAYAVDPRVIEHNDRIKEQRRLEAERKRAEKKAKQEAVREKIEERERAEREAAEEERRQRKAKKERLKAARRAIREYANAIAEMLDTPDTRGGVDGGKGEGGKGEVDTDADDADGIGDSREPLSGTEVDDLCRLLDFEDLETLEETARDAMDEAISAAASGGSAFVMQMDGVSVHEHSGASNPAHAGAEAAIEVFRRRLHSARKEHAEEEAARREELLRKEREKEAARAKSSGSGLPWSPEEVAALAKGIKRYPGGTRERWEAIASYVNSAAANPVDKERTKEECIAKASGIGDEDRERLQRDAFERSRAKRGLASGPSEGGGDDGEGKVAASGGGGSAGGGGGGESGSVWTPEQQKALEDALRKYPASMDKKERWTKIAAAVDGKKRKECVARYKEIKAALSSKPATPTPAPDAWTPEQQEALEKALRKYPASMDKKERWNSIAEAVPEKNRKECVERFKEIRAALKAKK